MTIELSGNVEERLQELAAKQGREIGVLVEEALEDYLVASAITDLDPADVAETQMALMGSSAGLLSGRTGVLEACGSLVG